MKITSYLSISLLATSLLFSACKKKDEPTPPEAVPSADFKFDKDEYTEGETVQLTNTSINGASARWTSPEGTTGKGATFTYAIPRQAFDRNINFRLDAISASGLKTDYVVKSVKVKAARGKLVFYQGYTSSLCTIFIDGVKIGDYNLPATGGIPFVPECGNTAYPNATAIVGSHLIQHQFNGGFMYSQNVEVTENNCTVVRLQ